MMFCVQTPAADTEVHQDHLNENKQRLFLQSLQKSQILSSLGFGRKGLKGREEEVSPWERKGSSRYVMIGDGLPGRDAGGWLARRGTSVVGWGIWFLWLVLSW